MAKVTVPKRVASNPRHVAKSTKAGTTMTAAQKKAFVARMAKARKSTGSKNPSSNKKKSTKSTSKRKGSKNPNCKRRSNRNPEILGKPKELVVNVLSALLSAVATRQLPQWALGSANAGWQGYLANIVAAAAATFVASEFVGAGSAQAAVLGGGVIIADRILTEQFSPVGQYLSLTGLGDATAATSLGTVGDGYYIHPTIFDKNGDPIIPHQITDAALKAFANLPASPASNGNGTKALVPGMKSAPGARPGRY